jgi:hypothetical protein
VKIVALTEYTVVDFHKNMSGKKDLSFLVGIKFSGPQQEVLNFINCVSIRNFNFFYQEISSLCEGEG